MRPRVMAAACVVLTMIPATIRVQEEPDAERRWWRARVVQQQLRLSAEQIQRLDALFERGRPERIARHRQIEDLDLRLAHMMNDVGADDATVASLSGEVEALRAEQNIRRTLMLFAMYQTLTHEQRTLLGHIHRTGRAPSRPSPIR